MEEIPLKPEAEEKALTISIVEKIVRNNVLFPALVQIFRPLLRGENRKKDEDNEDLPVPDVDEESCSLESNRFEELEETLDDKMSRYFSTMSQRSETENVVVTEETGTQTENQDKLQTVGTQTIDTDESVDASDDVIVVKVDVSCQTEKNGNEDDFSMETMVKFLMKQEDPLIFAKQITKYGSVKEAEQVLELLKSCHDEAQVKDVLTLLKNEMLPRFPILQCRLAQVCLENFQKRPRQYTELCLQLCNQPKYLEKLLQIINAKKGEDHKELVEQLIVEHLPRFPKERALHQKLAFYCLEKFKDSPKNYFEFVVKLCVSEDTLGRLLQIIEEKTAFNSQWCQDLKDIMVQISGRCVPVTRLKNSFMRIVLDQFANDPSQWAYHLFNFGDEKDVARSMQLLEEYMTVMAANHENLFACMKQLVSQVKKRWPAAENDFFAKIFPRFIQSAQLKSEEYVKLFCGYIGYWRENPSYFRLAISALWKRMKLSNLKNWSPLLTDLFCKIAEEKQINSIMKNLCESMAEFVVNRIAQEERNGGKFALTQPSSLQLIKCLISQDRCEGCSQLEFFLKNEQQEKICITVNEKKRSCVRRQLDSVRVGQQFLRNYLRTEECDANRIRERYSGWLRGNCGGIGMTKLRLGSHLVPM